MSEPATKKHKSTASDATVTLARNTNQARGIAQFSLDFLAGKLGSGPADDVYERVEQFHTDSVVCGLSALALKTNAPTILRSEALHYPAQVGHSEEAKQKAHREGATVFGSDKRVKPEKAICANASAVREWDSNGTVFGFNKALGHTAGEFGHNDFYPVVIAACQMKQLDGAMAAKAMILLDEIRGRLCEVFSLKTYKIDHVVHGAIASAATFGALLGATVDQIESAIGMVVAHYIPWRAIRAGHQLSDSKGASAAISTEVAILAMLRAMNGFVGPKDIFRNPEAVFRQFEPTKSSNESPFDLVLSHSGSDFAVMGMHFKLGLYEHQSAGALHGLVSCIANKPDLVNAPDRIQKITITCYEPAFGIIGDPAKRNPTTRQSADHSMVYIVASKLRKAIALGRDHVSKADLNALWKDLILLPEHYGKEAIRDPKTRFLMDRIEFKHGGKEYDDKYPDGIPTRVEILDIDGKTSDSGLVMYPPGHARNTTCDLKGILNNKFAKLGALAVGEDKVETLLQRFANLRQKTSREIASLYGLHGVGITYREPVD